MANKKYNPMPDMSRQDCFMNKKYANIDFRKAGEFTLHIFYNCMFMNCNFKGVNFNYCRFINCAFTDCNLGDTHWHESNIEYTKFCLCSLRGASFKDFNFYESRFYGSILCDAVFILGYFIDSRICSAWYKQKCSGDVLSLVTKPYKGAIFNNAKFDDSYFDRIDFNKFSMQSCFFNGCTFGSDCKNIPYIPMTCPEEGSFIAYKKVLKYPSIADHELIAVLEIPADAKRLSGAGVRKCRCNKAKVLRFEDVNGNVLDDVKEGYSIWDGLFFYHVGEYVTEENFDEDRLETCSKGIHFFMNRQEAVEYKFT